MALFDRKPIDFVDQVLSNIDMFDLTYRITRCDRTRCAPNWSWHHAPNQDTGFNLWFIVAGGGTLQTSQACYELHPGDCFLLRLWDLNIGAPNPSKPLVVSWVCFDGLDRRGLVLPPVKYPAVREHRRIPDITFFDQLVQRVILHHREGPESAGAAVQWLKIALLEMVCHDRRSQLSGVPLEQYMLVDALCSRIREHPEKIANMKMLAAQAHCSVEHLIRIFKRHKRVTPWEFVIRCRMERAGNLLRFSTHTISQIADLLGYADIYSFSKQFKIQTGQTPSRYRQTP